MGKDRIDSVINRSIRRYSKVTYKKRVDKYQLITSEKSLKTDTRCTN